MFKITNELFWGGFTFDGRGSGGFVQASNANTQLWKNAHPSTNIGVYLDNHITFKDCFFNQNNFCQTGMSGTDDYFPNTIGLYGCSDVHFENATITSDGQTSEVGAGMNIGHTISFGAIISNWKDIYIYNSHMWRGTSAGMDGWHFIGAGSHAVCIGNDWQTGSDGITFNSWDYPSSDLGGPQIGGSSSVVARGNMSDITVDHWTAHHANNGVGFALGSSNITDVYVGHGSGDTLYTAVEFFGNWTNQGGVARNVTLDGINVKLTNSTPIQIYNSQVGAVQVQNLKIINGTWTMSTNLDEFQSYIYLDENSAVTGYQFVNNSVDATNAPGWNENWLENLGTLSNGVVGVPNWYENPTNTTPSFYVLDQEYVLNGFQWVHEGTLPANVNLTYGTVVPAYDPAPFYVSSLTFDGFLHGTATSSLGAIAVTNHGNGASGLFWSDGGGPGLYTVDNYDNIGGEGLLSTSAHGAGIVAATIGGAYAIHTTNGILQIDSGSFVDEGDSDIVGVASFYSGIISSTYITNGGNLTNGGNVVILGTLNTVSRTGLTAWWPLNAGNPNVAVVADLSPYGNFGTNYNGAAYFLGASGDTFTGSGSSFVRFPVNAAIATTNTTVAMWLNLTNNSVNQQFFEVNSAGGLGIMGVASGGNYYVHIESEGTGVIIQAGVAGGILPLNTWFHLAVTYAPGGACKYYTNGVLGGSATQLFTLGTTGYVTLGYDVANSQYPMDGAMRGVQVYNYALTPTQVATLASAVDNR